MDAGLEGYECPLWVKSGHKTDPPPASRCAITSPRSRELIFPGNLRRGKQGRASCPDFSRGKVDRLVVAAEAATRRRMLGHRFARAGSRESGYGRLTWEPPIPAPEDFEKPCVRPVALGVKSLGASRDGRMGAKLKKRVRDVSADPQRADTSTLDCPSQPKSRMKPLDS